MISFKNGRLEVSLQVPLPTWARKRLVVRYPWLSAGSVGRERRWFHGILSAAFRIDKEESRHD
jgi:hypothetical protein